MNSGSFICRFFAFRCIRIHLQAKKTPFSFLSQQPQFVEKQVFQQTEEPFLRLLILFHIFNRYRRQVFGHCFEYHRLCGIKQGPDSFGNFFIFKSLFAF